MFIRLFFMLFYIFSISRVKKRERERDCSRQKGGAVARLLKRGGDQQRWTFRPRKMDD